jgi:hypothetical protein
MMRIPAASVSHPAQLEPLLRRLHAGPSTRDIVHPDYIHTLPSDWQLSFGRVSPQPLHGDAGAFSALAATAFAEFERACAQLLANRTDIRRLILAGVDIDPQLASHYLNPATAPFSIRRLDAVVVDSNTLAIPESDEMPGGVVHGYWLDYAYGINQPRWEACLSYLTNRGPLVFVVSDNWSQVYLRDTIWFAQHLTARGYPAAVVSTNEVGRRLRVNPRSVTLDGRPVGTIWRLFPIFEATGPLVPLIQAASDGIVRLVPEFASWGNKTWFAIFWQEQDFFSRHISHHSMRILQRALPYSVIANTGRPFEFTLAKGTKLHFARFEDLLGLSQGPRRDMVVKVGGANLKSARSYGVVLGESISTKNWVAGLTHLTHLGAPIILQQFHEPARFDLQVLNVLNGSNQIEQYPARLLLRPWVIGGHLAGCTGIASESRRLHGSTGSCQIPVQFSA